MPSSVHVRLSLRFRLVTSRLSRRTNNTTTSPCPRQPHEAERSAVILALWLVAVVEMRQNYWLRDGAFDNRGVEYDPIGQFLGEPSPRILYTSRPVPPASTSF
jgi:hypothetical protein